MELNKIKRAGCTCEGVCFTDLFEVGRSTLNPVLSRWEISLKSEPSLLVAAYTKNTEEVLAPCLLALGFADKYIPSLVLELVFLELRQILKTSYNIQFCGLKSTEFLGFLLVDSHC